MTITKTLFAGALCALACRGPNDGAPERAVTAPPRVDRPDEARGPGAIPTDFSIEVGGGPVAAEVAANITTERTRIEPRLGSPGEFDVVVIAVDHDEIGFESGTREIRRVPAPAARVAALHRLVHERRAELQAPCIDPSIMDGATVRVLVHAGGADEQFSCTNASTPAFEALTTAFRGIVRDSLGS
jgi:hypothetical protein